MIKTYIQLAKHGDICNVLPLLHADAQAGQRQRLMVSAKYASILEGVSYVEPCVFQGEPQDISGAVAQAKAIGDPWVCTQIVGPVDQVREYAWKPAGMSQAGYPSFCQDSWAAAGRIKDWNRNLPLIFDQRNKERENALISQYIKPGKANILLATESKSSPFRYSPLLVQILSWATRDWANLVRLSDISAPRIYDLLGLFEKALCLITVDSAPLHLARAVPPLPVLAICNDSPALWNGSPWMPQHTWYCRYNDFPNRAVEMIEHISNLYSKPESTPNYPLRVWSEYQTRGQFLNNGYPVLRIFPGQCGRDTGNTAVNDPARLPYLKDVIRMALQKSPDPESRICLTRPGVSTEHPFKQEAQKHEMCYAYRMTVKLDEPCPTYQPIADLFCATSNKWREVLLESPDYVLNNDYFWSHGLQMIFRSMGAADITGTCYREASPPKTEPASFPPSTQHNSRLQWNYMIGKKIWSRYPKITEQHETVIIKAGIFQHAYNPTISRRKDGYFLCYRYHPDPLKLDTRIAMAELNEQFEVVNNNPIVLPGKSLEDPKLFVRADGRYLQWVSSKWPDNLAAQVQCAKIEVDLNVEVYDFPGNDWTSTQKNWVMWGRNVIYTTSPEYVIYRMRSGGQWDQHTQPGPQWPYGAIRGGTAPLPWDKKHMLRFFHSGANNEFGIQKRRYFVGAMLVENKWPFACVKVGSRPILYGSEVDDYKVKERMAIRHWKKSVVFPGGAVEYQGGYILAIGINDSACGLVKLTQKDLNL